ncbi:MAG: tRNA 4-thiouridine(8) synthase ThiI, partial [Oscillospiraceae bacterium]|nr:tRNA 4-thiouridine(8) synthase ThiI [Oscillospiraceae bacterium]
MNYGAYIVKYAEIGVKGKNRRFFEDALVDGVNRALAGCGGGFKVTCIAGRLYVEALGEHDFDDVKERLGRVFGVLGICPAVTIARVDRKLPDIDALCGAAVKCFHQVSGIE